MNNNGLRSTVQEEEDDEMQIEEFEELAFNTDFDPAFLDCWEEEEGAVSGNTSSSVNNSIHDVTTATTDSKQSDNSRNNFLNSNPLISTTTLNQLQSNDDRTTTANSLSLGEQAGDANWEEYEKVQQALFGVAGGAVIGASSECNTVTSAALRGTDPVAILPPFETTATGAAATAPALLGLLQQLPQATHVQGGFAPTSFSPAELATEESTNITAQQQNQPQQNPQELLQQSSATGVVDSAALLPLAFNALAAGVDLTSFLDSAGLAVTSAFQQNINENQNEASLPTTSREDPSNKIGVGQPSTAALNSSKSPKTANGPAKTANGPATNRKRGGGGGRRGRSRGQHGRTSKQAQKSAGDKEEEPPPFMLFDAPIELRHNYIKSLREQGLPELTDNNSFHYLQSSTNPVIQAAGQHCSSSSGAAESVAARKIPRLEDARHGYDAVGNKQIKNAKEQKRAQRITELIEQLRVRMEKGGWKVGIKSKLHTLSSCSGYLKHLVKVTQEKEAEVEKARNELETKKRKIESSQQDPSEPESTTSSLTLSSGSGSVTKKGVSGNGRYTTSESNDNCEQNILDQNGKTKSPIVQKVAEMVKSEAAGATDPAGEEYQGRHSKKYKTFSNESNSEEYSSSVDNNDSGKKSRNGHVSVSVGPVSSVSDITDNNKYNSKSSSSCDDTTGTMTAAANNERATSTSEFKNNSGNPEPSTHNTVCSDAAVVETSAPKDNSHDGSLSHIHDKMSKVGMSINTITTKSSPHRKRKCAESSERDSTSLEANFRLDYEEVFLKSNVPQIIASTTGRIVAFNEIFLRATALRRSQVDRLTIFSLVQTGMLSNLFELVAASLREDDRQETRDTQKSTPLQDYSTMTLPCVPFHIKLPHLYMTITLMSDEDVKKRCFHCIFTDSEPAVKGAVGSVTPQLLATLFQPIYDPNDGNEKKMGRETNQPPLDLKTEEEMQESNKEDTKLPCNILADDDEMNEDEM